MKKIGIYSLIFVLGVIISYIFFNQQNNESVGYKADTYYSSNSKLAHLLLNRAIAKESHVAWSTGNHTASPVPCGAIGPKKYIKKLNGIISNTEIAKVSHQAIKDGINVILVIGDGMGINHMSLPIYMRIAEGNKNETYFEKIINEGSCGLVLTNPVDGLVTGSATSGTTLSTGVKSYLHTVGLDTNGYELKTTTDWAKEKGYITSIITDAGITDGTPAAFYAHSPSRDFENKIASQLLNENIDIIFGGGAARFIPQNTMLKDFKYFKKLNDVYNSKSDRNDDQNLFREFEESGYTIITGKEELIELNKNTKKVLGLFAPGGIAAFIDRDTENVEQPSIINMAEKAFELINNQNKKYFLMLEAARIDWEAHDNDAGAVYFATEEMNRALKVCYEQYLNDKENTLLIFTADHETGGFSISYTKRNEDNQFRKTLKSGLEWTNKTDPLLFKEFIKLKNQKRSIHKDFANAKSVEELYELLNDNLDYNISLKDAEVIFKTRQSYIKGK